MSKYKLGGFQLAILLYIIYEYNRQIYTHEKNIGVALSYDDICRMLNVQRSTVQQIMKALCDEKLIFKRTGKGRKKTLYKPNKELLYKLLNEYRKINLTDK